MGNKRIFVTVGTTNFSALIDEFSSEDVLKVLVRNNYNFVQMQTGKDYKVKVDTNLAPRLNIIDKSTYVEYDHIILKYDEYFPNFEEEILKSDLVVSHAGAGTCLEVLRKNIPLLVVINEGLMDNHQMELAEQLQKDGYLYYCTCESLAEALAKDFGRLRQYPTPRKHLFSSYLDKCVGFSA